MTGVSDHMTSLLDRAKTAKTALFITFPGLLVSATIAMAAMFLSEHYGAPVMLFALLLGMAFNFLSQHGSCVPGIEMTSKKVLRIGVALLGARITFDQIIGLGVAPLLAVVAAVILTILAGIWISHTFGLGRRLGILTGGAVTICGASAALAIAAVLPRTENDERETIFTVLGVTTLSTVAMVAYPLVVSVLGLKPQEAGLFLGGTIHDVAQVVGAGYSISEQVGDTATFTKLLRVAMLLPAVMVLSLVFSKKKGRDKQKLVLPLPGFLFAFAVLVVVNSSDGLPASVQSTLIEISRWCLVSAIAALGMKTSLKTLVEIGFRPVALMVAETLFLALLIIGFIKFII
jgi:uncharacterized integral membrane protein (TIGR00698 family)